MTWMTTGLEANQADPHVVGVSVGGAELLLGAIDDRWWAVEDRCSHAGCSFIDDGELIGTTLICNCHGSEFDIRTGAVLTMPAHSPIRTYAVRVSDGMIEVAL